ncbi:DUF6093 family protein [Curtobacterium sp. MCLR17_034]|uniref:DUF6093 family protein n=1 Tax=Curtobacterium sp. MCLR17_034 TaxID=2175623 RepID=UPI000DA8B571|nr:DUF6093 family protein [Curtobacterium sp. MCLR17_034]PZF11763.1 hypothetical protein DEI98_06490 [Curtobacterium sp. MCLR17_034]
MSLRSDVERLLPDFRANAESLMTDTAQIGFEVQSTEMDGSGEYPAVFTPVYDGPCRFKAGNVQASDVEASTQLLVSQLATLSLPIGSSVDVQNGMQVRVTGSLTDPALPGTVARIEAPFRSSYATARRFAARVVSGG